MYTVARRAEGMAILHLLNPHLDLELDYIVRKPMRRTEILLTFHTRVKYISR